MSVEIGSKAPDFELKTKHAQGLKTVKLSDNYGKTQTLLLFVPLAFTPTCTTELCAATDDFDSYSELNATVYGISVDSPFALEAWGKAANINIPLLSDWHRQASEAYGILTQTSSGIDRISNRSVFVINKGGFITYKWVAKELGELPDFNRIKAALKEGSSNNP